MRLPSPEALLICSVLNTGDLGAALQRGVQPEHFAGYRAEWEFVLRYLRSYHDLPSPDVLTGSFPDFPWREASEAPYYADQVIERSNQRAVKQAVLAGADQLAAGDLAAAVATLTRVRIATPAALPVDAIRSHLVADQLDDERAAGVPYPWTTLQHNTGGLHPGDFAVVGARTGVGKSWSLVCSAVHAALAGFRVRYYSLEMPCAQLVARIHTVIANVFGYRISHRSLHERTVDRIAYKRLLAQMENGVPGSIDVVDSCAGRISPATLSNSEGIDLNVVDYLGLMSSPTGSRAVEDWRTMAAISNQCKEVAITTGTPILAAVQINREGARGMNLPTVTQLAQSDAIGQDCDVLLTQRRMNGPLMRYGLQKNRHGLSDVLFYSRFEPDFGRFTELNREQAEDLADEYEAV